VTRASSIARHTPLSVKYLPSVRVTTEQHRQWNDSLLTSAPRPTRPFISPYYGSKISHHTPSPTIHPDSSFMLIVPYCELQVHLLQLPSDCAATSTCDFHSEISVMAVAALLYYEERQKVKSKVVALLSEIRVTLERTVLF
jgi:hypothetical protein